MSLLTIAEKKGMEQGIQKGLKQGIQQGVQKGIQQGLRKAIQTAIEIKFGEEAVALFAREIEKIESVELLEKALEEAKRAASTRDLEEKLQYLLT
ncbi:hypothetical protein Calab_2233 [Caldithrix abyssi DSM 13497]|uniref:Uncharacterized protein n=2 Tax=Caldithrix abyssi DSM 13497 TaxID=880073 RepID=H1XWK5_CALAY|nr:hypothetical protein [Caldithrix abyssi]EHO41843.1 hypothetical protein Calab_2233 [Caldithrix abyssi DSM 13497]